MVFDKIFYGEDPLEVLHLLDDYTYTQAINPLDMSPLEALNFLYELKGKIQKEDK